jgi:DNA helicase-2/ATP-dependent DNA helicase PcrA
MPIDLQKELNDKQYLGAKNIEGPVLIIAGAGSGKTRMITFRIAHMLEKGIPQASILALTFTNKAAREMEERVRKLVKKKLSNITISTFHAFGVQILRKEIRALKYRPNFSIYDQSDKNSLIKEVAGYIGLPVDDIDYFAMNQLFSAIKTGRKSWDSESVKYKKLYEECEDHAKVYNSVDFDDLLVKPLEIFETNPEILDKYRNRYKYIMVDEFQDTSLIQYRLIKMLAETNRNICVVGDDDQSIYSWRGANYQNIIEFEKDFPERIEIKLEQNYRSTENILAAANSLIANNKNRKEKKLWTGSGTGKAIEIYYPANESMEAAFIADMIKTFALKEQIKYHEVGILVRTNSLTSSIEEALLDSNIPYKVSGGESFFQRKEIKDLIAYLRVITNPDDDISLLRVINTPRRGIGKNTLRYITEISEKKNYSLYSALSALRYGGDSNLSDKIKNSIENFINFIEYYRDKLLSGRKLAESVSGLVDAVEYWGYLMQEHQKNEKIARYKFGNITRFIDMLERWETDPDNLKPDIYTWLNRITLINRDDEEDSENGKVNLMTIHSAKGLEYDLVFLAGVEDHIIPHSRSMEENPENIEEERRLFYVAITRARLKLFISSCRQRKHMRDLIDCVPSRFLDEIPAGLMENHKAEEAVSADDSADLFARMKSKFREA